MNKTYQFKIFVFRAIDNPKLCDDYINGHVKVLTDYGIENVTTNNNDWKYNPNIYCTVTIDKTNGEMVGGVRIQIADGNKPLPVELAIGSMDNSIHTKVAEYGLNGGIGESCGLWMSKKVKGIGISRYMMWASIASSSQLKFNTMLGICAGYTLKLFGEIGFVIDNSLGNNGGFPYPNDNYTAHVIGILNALTLETAQKNDKTIMLSMRNNPNQTRTEINNGIISEIDYNLLYESKEKVNFKQPNFL